MRIDPKRKNQKCIFAFWILPGGVKSVPKGSGLEFILKWPDSYIYLSASSIWTLDFWMFKISPNSLIYKSLNNIVKYVKLLILKLLNFK